MLSVLNNPVDFMSTTNFEFLYLEERFLAISKPILSEKISLPFSSTTPKRSPSPSKAKPISALFFFMVSPNAWSIFKSSGLGLYLGKLKSRLQSSSITSQPILLSISGANIPAVPLPQATTTLILFLILFLDK